MISTGDARSAPAHPEIRRYVAYVLSLLATLLLSIPHGEEVWGWMDGRAIFFSGSARDVAVCLSDVRWVFFELRGVDDE